MRVRSFGVLALLLFVSVQASAQSEKFLSRLQGSWSGEGKAFGMPARMQIKWEWVLDNKFLWLSLKNEMQRAGGPAQVFEGQAFYRSTGADKCEAHWFDSRGVNFPIKAQIEADTLIAFWGSPDKEEGKSSYRLVDDQTLEVVDWVKQKDGTWREFGRAIVKRV